MFIVNPFFLLSVAETVSEPKWVDNNYAWLAFCAQNQLYNLQKNYLLNSQIGKSNTRAGFTLLIFITPSPLTK